MGPKRNLKSKTRNSSQINRMKTNKPSLLPIYQILLEKYDQKELLETMENKIEELYQNSQEAFVRSVMLFVLNLCGLGKYGEKIDWRHNVQQQLEELMDMAADQYKKYKTKSSKNKSEDQQQFPQFPLLSAINNNSNKALDKFIKNTDIVFKFILNIELTDNETGIIKTIFQTLCSASRCKLRNIRASTMEVIKIIIDRSLIAYGHRQLNDKSKATKILVILEEGYIEQIIKHRLKDIDSSIRDRAFLILQSFIKKVPNEMLEIAKLQKIFSPLLSGQHSPKIVEKSMKMLIQLFEIKKTKQSTTNLIQYTEKLLPILYDTALLQSNILSLQCISKLQKASQVPKLLTAKQILRLFEAYSNNQSSQYLRLCLQIFLYSISSEQKTTQLVKHRQNIIIEFMSLMSALLGIISGGYSSNHSPSYTNHHSAKILKQIMACLFTTLNEKATWVITCHEIFLILFSQYYYSQKDEVDIQVREIQIYILLCMSIELHMYTLKAYKACKQDSATYQHCNEQIDSYNKNVFNNAKQIFYEKIEKYKQFSYLYLRLFSWVNLPIADCYHGNVEFVIERILGVLRQQKFIVMAGEDITGMFNIVKECVHAYHTLMEGQKQSALLLSLNIRMITDGTSKQLDPIDIIKISSLSSFYSIDSLQENSFLQLCLSTYSHSMQSMIQNASKLQILTFLSNTYRHLFTKVFEQPSQSIVKNYLNFRGALLDLITLQILNKDSEYWLVRLGAFGLLMHILKTGGNDCVLEKQIYQLYCQLSHRQLESLKSYITNVFYSEFCSLAKIVNIENPSVQLIIPGFESYFKQNTQILNQTTNLLKNLTLQPTTLKQNIINQLFPVFTQNHKLCIQNIDILAKFILLNIIPQMPSIKQQINSITHQNISDRSTILQTTFEENNGANAYYTILKKYKFEVSAHRAYVDVVKQLIRKEGLEVNRSRFIFWRAFNQILNILGNWQIMALAEVENKKKQGDDEDEEEKQNILDSVALSLLQHYLKTKKKNASTAKILTDKMMLYIADALDKTITDLSTLTNNIESVKGENVAHKKAEKLLFLNILHLLIKKVHRRYPKQVIHRLSIFLNNKIQSLSLLKQQSQNVMDIEEKKEDLQEIDKQILKAVENLKKYLQKISKNNKIQQKDTKKEKDDQNVMRPSRQSKTKNVESDDQSSNIDTQSEHSNQSHDADRLTKEQEDIDGKRRSVRKSTRIKSRR